LIEVDIPENASAIGKAIVQLALPKTALIVMIHRKGKYITANGETIIQAGDHMLIMADNPDTVNRVNLALGTHA
jgi:potassium/hydrogen antiporter